MKDQQHNYKLTIAYDGTNYSGWQIQPNSLTIQEILEKKLQILLREEVRIIGSGRTDAGVHALGQVANFKCQSQVNLQRILNSLNGILPHDIRIKSIESVPLSFHAQYSAIAKTYHYHLHLEQVHNPFDRLYRWHIFEKVDLELLKAATQYFVGTHDFTSFANEAHAGCAARDPVRTMKRLDLIPETYGVRLEFEADGFLYKMVRNIVGLLIEVAIGKYQLSDIPKIFEAKDRKMSGKAAPAHGLFLMKVDYP